MNPIEAALRRVGGDLAAMGRRWAIVGGLAVSARAEPRTTRDIDVAVAVEDDADAERLCRELQGKGYRVSSLVEQEATRRLATARLASPPHDGTRIVVDLLFASSGIEAEIVAQAESLEILPDLRLPVARIDHLIALKVLARDDRRRPQDWDDIQALLREADESDVARAREALALIAERGYHRRRNLIERFAECLGERARKSSP